MSFRKSRQTFKVTKMFTPEQINFLVRKGLMSLDFNKEPQNLYEPMGYMLGLGGKYLRPRLCLSAFSLFSDDITDEILYPAVALEIFHEFTLIHDDIMDNSPTRRNQPTVHSRWNDNIAILSGDAMSIMAYRYLALCPRERLQDVLKLFSDMAMEVCEGQQKDMDFEEQPFVTMDEYLDMVGQKTGALIACSAAMGALLAGAGEEKVKALYDYGYNTGLAFQITDDYLDTFGDPVTFGKPIGGDIANNKKSWLLTRALEKLSCKEALLKAMDLPVGTADERAAKIAAVRAIYDAAGVGDDARAEVRRLSDCALAAIRGLDAATGHSGDAAYRRLADFADRLVSRAK